MAIVITNQPVIARGEVTKDQLEEIHNKMETLLGAEGAYLDAIYYCPHHPRTLKIENGVAYKDDYLGVDIDIFALDGSSPDNTEYEEMRDRIYKLYNWYTIIRCGMTGSLRHKIRVATYKMQHWNANNLIKEAVQLCEKYDYNTSKYATRYGRYSKGFRVDKECYESTIMKDFEGELFAIPIGYDKVLRAQFGDYMQLPPEEKRVTHHNNNVFWK